MNITMCRFFPFKQLCSKSKIFKNGCVISSYSYLFCWVFNSYMASCSLACSYLKTCWKGENSHGCPQKFFQGRGQRHHITYIFQVPDVVMQMDVHKTLYCFCTTKKMDHECTRSICIYFEIFFKWSWIRVCHKSELSLICYSVCWIGA